MGLLSVVRVLAKPSSELGQSVCSHSKYSRRNGRPASSGKNHTHSTIVVCSAIEPTISAA